MNGSDIATAPQEWSEWPPPKASRADRRACAKRGHDGMTKQGYCVLCGAEAQK